MIGRSLPEYVFIRLCILGLRLIAPASIVYILLSCYHGKLLVSELLGYYAAAEAFFYLCIFLPRSRHLQKLCWRLRSLEPYPRISVDLRLGHA
ncbi:hypothetical protein C8Q80DRAFT_756848 [Daedaleopsis nitida]|nr:hypothetical protein C8Q80DRAFT_756848 [Daedaleopsis nitida]